MKVKSLTLEKGLTLSYVGKDLEEGALPALFYFALSNEESLGLDPFNQPVAFLANHAMNYPVRIFSLTLPFHGHGHEIPPTKALIYWADEISKRHNIIEEFVDLTKRAVDKLIALGMIVPDQVGVAGLSRGAFIACHVAAKIPEMQTILGFAPLTELTYAKEFHAHKDDSLAKKLGLHNLIDSLIGRSLRFYIGNLDTRVGTSLAFQFIDSLSQASLKAGIRSPKVELIISPSIGHQGHGTSKQIFEQGAAWMADQLRIVHA